MYSNKTDVGELVVGFILFCARLAFSYAYGALIFAIYFLEAKYIFAPLFGLDFWNALIVTIAVEIGAGPMFKRLGEDR
jgi:hypothetical protein